MVTGTRLRPRCRGWPLVHSRCGPQSTIGISGTLPPGQPRGTGLEGLDGERLAMVASGKTPMISPARSAVLACRYAALPCFTIHRDVIHARMSGPQTRCPNIAFFAMKRTSRLDGSAASPAKTKSR